MRFDARDYGGPCCCGRDHDMVTKLCVIDSGALSHFEEYMAEAGLSGRLCAVYDTNTYAIPALKRPKADQEIVLDAEGLHANERAVSVVMGMIEEGTSVLVAVGTGTITDIVRYSAFEKGLPFVSVPTAASCDAFCSNVAAMTWNGYKLTVPRKPPVLVVADLDVISTAPWFLTASGIGDMLAKHIALADWKIAEAVAGEYLCPKIYGIMRKALDDTMTGCGTIQQGDLKAYEAVTYGLLMSGIAMQMTGTSRAASGAEHHISHFIEMEPEALGVHTDALHGEKVGVGTVIVSAVYHKLAQIEDIAPYVVPYSPLADGTIMSVFGPKLFQSCKDENSKDSLAAVTQEKLISAWPEIRKIISGIPSSEDIYSLLGKLGAKRALPDIGVPEDKLSLITENSAMVRNRLTLMRMRRMIKF